MENTETPVSMKETKLEWFKKTFTKSVSGFKIIRTAVTVGVVGYLGYTYIVQRLKKKLVSSIHNETILRWNYDDIHISESKASSDSILDFAVNDPSHLSFRELLETLSMAEEDPRIQGLIINFGKTSNKNEDSSPLGLAQIQEVREKILHLSKVKRIEFGDKSKFIAYTDDFTDQRKYYLATAFDQIQVGPLAQIPFYGLGARSMVDYINLRFQSL